MKKVPEIRFKEFSEDWEKRKLGEITKSYSGGTPAVGEKEYYDGNIPFIRSGEINENHTELFITERGLNNSSAAMVKEGDILYALYGATSGEVSRSKLTGAINQAILAILPNTGFDAEYLMQWLSMKKKIIVNTYLQGGQGNLSSAIIKNLNIYLPSYEEQVRIGKILKNIDTLITLNQCTLEKMKSLKNSMLNKMFPKNGAKVPEIRVEEFNGDWESFKLREIVQITMGQSPDGSTYSDTPSDYILIQGNADLQNGWVVPRVWTTQCTKKTYIGDLIMSVRAPAGAIGKTAYNAVIGRGVAAIKGNEFIYQTLVKMDLEGYWKKLSAGSTFESLNSENILNAEILIPTMKEQEQIGSYFKNFDHLITLHQRKLEKLKQFKESMINKMFI